MVKKEGWTPWPLKYALRSTLLLAVNQKWGLFFDMSFLFVRFKLPDWYPNSKSYIYVLKYLEDRLMCV